MPTASSTAVPDNTLRVAWHLGWDEPYNQAIFLAVAHAWIEHVKANKALPIEFNSAYMSEMIIARDIKETISTVRTRWRDMRVKTPQEIQAGSAMGSRKDRHEHRRRLVCCVSYFWWSIADVSHSSLQSAYG